MQIFWPLCSSTRVSDMLIVSGLSSVRSLGCYETIMKLIVLNFKLKRGLYCFIGAFNQAISCAICSWRFYSADVIISVQNQFTSRMYDSGLQVQLNPLEPKIMDSGSWHWNYKIHGPHVQLELVET